MNMDEREFSADSEYRIRFVITFYRSRVIRRSLVLVLAIFTKNANFMDEYLENQIFLGYAVSQGVHTHYHFQPRKVGIKWIDFWQKSKKCSKMQFFVLYGWTVFFLENRASSLKIVYSRLTW